MFTIADTTSKTLADALNLLAKKDIQNLCSHKIYERGVDYRSAVGSFRFSDDLNAEVTVSGTERYRITMRLRSKEILADCTCPYTKEYGDVCKHIVAALLTFNTSTVSAKAQPKGKSSTAKDAAIFREYLESLEHKEIVALVERFATAEFRREIVGRLSSGTTAEKKLRELNVRLQKVMKSKRYDSMDDYLHDVTTILKEAQGFWTHSPKVMLGMITDVMSHFDSAMESGDFEENYYDEEAVPDTDALAEVVMEFFHTLGTKDKYNAIDEIIAVAEECSYDTFDSFPGTLDELYTTKDLPALLGLVLKAADAGELYKPNEYYALLSESLSDATREALLRDIAHESSSLTLEFVQCLRKGGKLNDAEGALDGYYTAGKRDATYLSLRLELARERNEPRETMHVLCANTLNDAHNAAVLRIATKALPDYTVHYENMMQEQYPSIFREYLEQEGRLDECEEFFKVRRSAENLVDREEANFYMRHIHHFPQQAEQAILETIERNLVQTGGSFYDNIAKALKLLLEINEPKARQVYQMLKVEYKRRTNLIVLIDKVMKSSPQKPPQSKPSNPFDALPKKRTW